MGLNKPFVFIQSDCVCGPTATVYPEHGVHEIIIHSQWQVAFIYFISELTVVAVVFKLGTRPCTSVISISDKLNCHIHLGPIHVQRRDGHTSTLLSVALVYQPWTTAFAKITLPIQSRCWDRRILFILQNLVILRGTLARQGTLPGKRLYGRNIWPDELDLLLRCSRCRNERLILPSSLGRIACNLKVRTIISGLEYDLRFGSCLWVREVVISWWFAVDMLARYTNTHTERIYDVCLCVGTENFKRQNQLKVIQQLRDGQTHPAALLRWVHHPTPEHN